MTESTVRKIIEKNRPRGWVLEPDAKALMKELGFDIPKFILTDSVEAAGRFLDQAPCPLVAKAVSGDIVHKTEHDAVVTGISTRDSLAAEMERMLGLQGCEQILVEHMVKGLEIIIGAKTDFQFGPVVLLGLGGTSVEIYNDTAIRMAPLTHEDVASMVLSLKASRVLAGYRGGPAVNMTALTRLVTKFSHLAMTLEGDMESIDLNPVICTESACVIADARIILQPQGKHHISGLNHCPVDIESKI